MANSKGAKNTVSSPPYPVSGPPPGEGTQLVTGPEQQGPPGVPGGGTDVPLGMGFGGATQAPAQAGMTGNNQPRHPAESGGDRGPAAKHGSTNDQPKHPAERAPGRR